MVSRKLGWFGLGLLLAAGAVGCVHSEQAPEPWAALPVLVSPADAGSFTVRVDDRFSLTGRESEEVAERANLKKKLPEAFSDKLGAAGFKVVGPTDQADLILTVQSTDLEWTGHFWEAKGHVGVNLMRPDPRQPAPGTGAADAAPPEPPPEGVVNPYVVAKVVAGFDHLDVPHTAEIIAATATDQLVRSPDLAQWVKDKHAQPPPASPPGSRP